MAEAETAPTTRLGFSARKSRKRTRGPIQPLGGHGRAIDWSRALPRLFDAIAKKRLSITAACAVVGISRDAVHDARRNDPAGDVATAINYALGLRLAHFESRLVEMAQKGGRGLGATIYFLKTQGRILEPGWTESHTLTLEHQDRTPQRHVIHTDMAEIRARAKANEDAAALVREVETASAVDVG